jgi:Sec-independent protein secretion pathway component TatC
VKQVKKIFQAAVHNAFWAVFVALIFIGIVFETPLVNVGLTAR